MEITYKIANGPITFEHARNLFVIYAISTNLPLTDDYFMKDVKNIGKVYNLPGGTVVLAYDGFQPVGCAGVRQLEQDVAEIKRMYVLPEYRGFGIGKKLFSECLSFAKKTNYKKIRLDIFESMIEAQDLYRSFGFREILPNQDHRESNVVHFEKSLES